MKELDINILEKYVKLINSFQLNTDRLVDRFKDIENGLLVKLSIEYELPISVILEIVLPRTDQQIIGIHEMLIYKKNDFNKTDIDHELYGFLEKFNYVNSDVIKRALIECRRITFSKKWDELHYLEKVNIIEAWFSGYYFYENCVKKCHKKIG